MRKPIPLLFPLVLLMAACATVNNNGSRLDANAANDPLVTEEFMVPAVDPGISIYVRNKHPQHMQSFPGEQILLFVHGATYPSETTFDLKLNGLSWMDYIAQHGYDVYLVDVRGYAKSTRPPELDKPAADNDR